MRDSALLRESLVDPTRVLSSLGLLDRRSRRQRQGYMIACPWHDERTASCSVQVRGGTLVAHCFACGEGGDVIALIAAARQLSDWASAFRVARELAGILPPISTTASRGLAAPTRPRGGTACEREHQRPNSEGFDSVATPLLHLGRLDGSPLSAATCEYLASRNLLECARAEGWASLPGSPRAQSAWIQVFLHVFGRRQIDQCGLIVDGAFAHNEHTLVIPWRAPDGTVATIQRRRLDGRPECKYVFPLGRGATWPYGVELLRDAAPDLVVVLVEGAMDVLARRLLDADTGRHRVVLGVPGGGWRGEWVQLTRARRVVVATDADPAGDRYATEWTTQLIAGGALSVDRERPPAKDWADVVASRKGRS